MRRTSHLAYQQIEADGTLGRLQWAVYQHLFRHGPLTTRQINRDCPEIEVHVISPRITELSERGVVQEAGEVTCEFTGKLVMLWDVTENLPRKLGKKLQAVSKATQAERTRCARIARETGDVVGEIIAVKIEAGD